MTKICLNMIVRNEADKIERCLRSALPYVQGVAILDTGSTDATKQRIAELCDEYKVKFILRDGCFEDFSQARNDALALAREWFPRTPDAYFLLMDADMQLVVADPHAFDDLENQIAIQMVQKGGTLAYQNTRLLRADQTALYIGATHEYLDVYAPGLLQGAMFIDHADGSNRNNKAARDIKLLTRELRTQPENPRTWFYLANSYKDIGLWKRAAKAYEKRAELGGYEEEVWQSIVNRAHCLKELGDEPGFIKGLLDAYARRPTRVEPLYDLARHYREKPNHQAVSTLFSEAGMTIPMPNDGLFINQYAYEIGCREEFAITGFYDATKRDRAFTVSDQLSLDPRASEHTRHTQRVNSFWFLRPLSAHVKSFTAAALPRPPHPYTPLNPSVMNFRGRLVTTVRTVNYRIDDQGRYLIKGDDGSITNDNPIDTINWLYQLKDDLTLDRATMLHNEEIEPQYKLVRGYEDMRLFGHAETFFFSATCRDRLASGTPQQVLGHIDVATGKTIFHHAMSDGSQCEKNWMPVILHGGGLFAYRLNKFVTVRGNTTVEHDVGLDVSGIAGGSQLIPFMKGYLCLVHEGRQRPDGSPLRYYSHRFAWLDCDFKLRKLTRPFCLNDRQIEFAAGLCWHPDGKRLVLSYGLRDEEAVLATVDADELNHWLWHD